MPQIAAVSRAMPIAVYVNPVTNRVEVGLAVAFAADPKGLLSQLAADMGVALAAEHWAPLIESELARFAREKNDVYALAIPYHVVIVDRGSRK